MAKTQKINMKKWVRGINAAAQRFAQPQGSFPRASNLLYQRRGALATCDGSLLISAFDGAVQPAVANLGPIIEAILYEPIGGARTYFALAKDFNTHLGAPGGLAVAAGAAGALNGAYKWVVTALDGAGGETIASAEVTQALVNQKGAVTWTAVTNATGYNVYRTVVGGAAGTEHFSGTSATNSYTDNVADSALGAAVPPVVDTTQVTQFYKVPAPSYGASDIVFTFPADPPGGIVNPDGTTPGGGGGGTGGSGGSGGGGGGGGGGASPAGGVVGNVSPIPQILQFRNLMILLLGNGFPPYSSDGTTPNTIPLVNNFVASYASRTASTAQNVGDQISVNIGGTNYIFTCTQAGITSSGAAPAFSAVEGSVVADGTVYWRNSGRVAVVTAPRGAAHGIIYAGSLWVGNTSPTTTSDNFDGPSCLKMSDLNNPNSWNPLNVAFLDRDDGTQITGMATFTIAGYGIPPSGSLVVFKDFSTFQVNGVFGASNLSIQKAPTDMGCVAGRTVQFVPGFGIVRLTHLGFAMFDGDKDRLLSEEIRPYLFGGQPDIGAIDWNFVYFAKAAQTASPPMYVCACPVLSVGGATTLNAAVSATGGIVPTRIFTRYAFVAMRDGNGTMTKSDESVVTFTKAGQQFLVTFPAGVPASATVFYLFFGSVAGQEDSVITFLPSDVTGTTVTLSPANAVPGQFGVGPYVGSSQGRLVRLFCYDLVLKAWGIVDLPFAVSLLKQFRTIGTIPITVLGGFSDGGLRRWLGGAGFDLEWDAGAVNAGAPDARVRWSVETPEVFGKDASDRVYFRQVAIRGVGDPATLNVQVKLSGAGGLTLPSRNVTSLPMGGGEWAAYADIGATGVDASAILGGSGPIEIDSVDWLAIAKAIRGRVTV